MSQSAEAYVTRHYLLLFAVSYVRAHTAEFQIISNETGDTNSQGFCTYFETRIPEFLPISRPRCPTSYQFRYANMSTLFAKTFLIFILNLNGCAQHTRYTSWSYEHIPSKNTCYHTHKQHICHTYHSSLHSKELSSSETADSDPRPTQNLPQCSFSVLNSFEPACTSIHN